MAATLASGSSRDWSVAKIAGGRLSVTKVAPMRPPTTARPSGAVCSPRSPSPSAIEIIPAIIAKLVIRIGRRRLSALLFHAANDGEAAPTAEKHNSKRKQVFHFDIPFDVVSVFL